MTFGKQISLYDATPDQFYDLMSLEEMREHEWDVSWSGGKDSTATLILMHENNIRVRQVTYVRMMYDDVLPATLPVMTDFVDRAIETLRSWGYEVVVVKSKKSAVEVRDSVYFKSIYPTRNGKKYGITGFSRGQCNMTKSKTEAVRAAIGDGRWQMIGYAADETKRLHRLGGQRQSILATLGIYEADTFDLCRRYNLLSPLYSLGMERDGCFFCPSCAKREREYLHENHPELIALIYDLIEQTDAPIEYMPNCWIHDYIEHGHELRESQKGLNSSS